MKLRASFRCPAVCISVYRETGFIEASASDKWMINHCRKYRTVALSHFYLSTRWPSSFKMADNFSSETCHLSLNGHWSGTTITAGWQNTCPRINIYFYIYIYLYIYVYTPESARKLPSGLSNVPLSETFYHEIMDMPIRNCETRSVCGQRGWSYFPHFSSNHAFARERVCSIDIWILGSLAGFCYRYVVWDVSEGLLFYFYFLFSGDWFFFGYLCVAIFKSSYRKGKCSINTRDLNKCLWNRMICF